jgi:hypothetical protein
VFNLESRPAKSLFRTVSAVALAGSTLLAPTLGRSAAAQEPIDPRIDCNGPTLSINLNGIETSNSGIGLFIRAQGRNPAIVAYFPQESQIEQVNFIGTYPYLNERINGFYANTDTQGSLTGSLEITVNPTNPKYTSEVRFLPPISESTIDINCPPRPIITAVG